MTPSSPSRLTPSSAADADVAPSSERVQQGLLITKVLVPAPAHALLLRHRLFALLDEGTRRPLTLVSAPAGFGKTSLLESWVQSRLLDSYHVAWVSLDEGDNDTVRFWSYVLTALDRCAPGVSQAALTLLRAPHPLALDAVLTRLLNQLSQTSTTLVLILDDYHVIKEPVIHTMLNFLLEHQPPQLHLLLSTRSEPPLKLSRLRARGLLLEVHDDDLRCSTKEASQFLDEVMGIRLPQKVLEQVMMRTEGWLVGLQLLGLSLRGQADPASILEALTGNQRYILDYLTEEVLRQQSPSTQKFLLCTSILDPLNGSLCDAVLEQTGSQDVLEELERANVFVCSIDQQRRWFRYHAILAYMHEDVALTRELCQEALQDLPANHHLLGVVLLSQGSAFWLENDMQSASETLMQACDVCRRTGNFYAMHVAMSYLAQVRGVQGQLSEAIRLSRKSLELATGQISEIAHSGLHVGLGAFLYERNELEEAEVHLLRGLALGRQESNALVLIGGNLTLARVMHALGHQAQARTLMQEAMQLAQQHAITWTWVAPVAASEARLWLLQGNLDAAAHWADEHMPADADTRRAPSGSNYLHAAKEMILARIWLAQSKYTQALDLLARLSGEAKVTGRMGHVLEILVLTALTYHAQGNSGRALAVLAEALSLARPEGYIRLFVDEGEPMVALLSRLREQQRRQGPTPYLDTVLAAFPQEASRDVYLPPRQDALRPSAPQQGLLDPLSERELEVLRGLAQGASNQEIADRLVITVDTVKRHVSNILGKLEASNRTQAVARARSLGLLSDGQ